MRCRSARKLVFEFLDGLTDDAKRLNLEKHLAECTECEKLASKLTRSMDLLHRAPLESPDENFAWNIRLKLNQERNAIQQSSISLTALLRSWNLRYATAAVAGFAAVVVVGLFAVNSGLTLFGSGDQVAAPTESVEPNAAEFAAEGSSPPVDERSTPEPFVSGGGSLGRPVSVGGGANQGRPDLTGVIDESTKPVVLDPDSITKTETEGLSPEARIHYLEGRIRLLQSNLEKCQATKKDD
jgi:hypothetical protein